AIYGCTGDAQRVAGGWVPTDGTWARDIPKTINNIRVYGLYAHEFGHMMHLHTCVDPPPPAARLCDGNVMAGARPITPKDLFTAKTLAAQIALNAADAACTPGQRSVTRAAGVCPLPSTSTTTSSTTTTIPSTGLQWEKKTGDDGVPDAGDLHDVDNVYSWS